jgi:hypothetical protein
MVFEDTIGSVLIKMGLKSTVPLDIAKVKTELKEVENAEDHLEQKTDQTTRAMASDFQKVGDAAKAMGKSLTLYVTTPLLAIAAASIYAAGNAAETQSKFEQVYGELSGDVQAWAEEFGNAAGRSTTDLQDMLATMGSIVKAMGLTGEAGAEFSETITQLAIDMGSFNNVSDERAFSALRSAITGEYEAMKGLGVVINQAKVEQELLNMGIEGGVKVATDAQVAQARLNIIWRATADAQGDAERTAGSFANQLKALQADAKEAAEMLGSDLLPAAQSIIGVVRQMIQGYEELDDTTQSVILVTGGFAAAVGPAILVAGTFVSSIGKLKLALEAYRTSTFAATLATRGLTAAMMSTPWTIVLVGAAAVVSSLAILTFELGGTESATDNVSDSLKGMGDTSGYTSNQLRDLADELRKEAEQLRKSDDIIKTILGSTNALADSYRIQEQAAEDLEATQKDLDSASYEAMATVVDGMNAARDAVQAADGEYQQHKQTISDLTDEYDKLYNAVNNLTEDISDQKLTVEGASISYEEAQINFAKVLSDPESTELEIRTANLQVALALDRMEDSNQKLIDLEAEKNETLNGMSMDQAKVKLSDLEQQIKDEEKLRDEALENRNAIQDAYDQMLIKRNEDTGNTLKEQWADVVKFFEENTAYATVEYQTGALSAAFGVNSSARDQATTASAAPIVSSVSSNSSIDNSMAIENMNFNNGADINDFWRARDEQIQQSRVRRGIRI